MRVIMCGTLDACTLLIGQWTTTKKNLYTCYQLVVNVGLLMLASTVTSFLSREPRTHRESLHTSQVNRRQKAYLRQLVQQVINTKQWIDILLYLSVQPSIVNLHLQLPSLLPKEDDGGPTGRARRTNPPLFEVFIKLPSHFC